MWKIKYWDGVEEDSLFADFDTAMAAARNGLKDWMEKGDRFAVDFYNDNMSALWVDGADANAFIFKVK